MPTTKRTYAPNRIRELRLERNLTLEELAARISEDVSFATLHKLEKRHMGLTLDWMINIAKALGVTPEEVAGKARGRMLPILGRIPAGNWLEAVEDANGWMPVGDDVGGVRAF